MGDVTEPNPIEEKDSQFDNQTLRYFEHKAVFKQKIKVLSKNDFKVTGSLEFMCCNDEKCIIAAHEFKRSGNFEIILAEDFDLFA